MNVFFQVIQYALHLTFCIFVLKLIAEVVRIQLRKRTNVCKVTSCPAGKSGYCKHLMAWLHEIAEYSLNRLTGVA